jgi:putative hydroxymethylpyrimidine transport system substrate-binding protein
VRRRPIPRPALPRPAVLLAAALLAVVVGACGEKKDTTEPPRAEPFELVLDFFPNADHVGIYAALANGEFRREGLDVRVRAPSDPSAPLKLVQAGRADLAISYEPEVLLARDRGARVVSVGAIVQRPLTSIVSLDPRIRRPADLEGKRVGTAGIPYQSAYLKAILQRANVNPVSVRETSVGFNLVPAMLSRKVDATLGSFWNYEGVQLQLQKRNPTIIRVDQAGVPTYNELVLAARRDRLPKQGNQVRRFLRALARGYEAARANPQKAVQQLVRANRSLDGRLQLASVRATLPVFFPADRRRPFGYQDRVQWAAYGDWMLRTGLVKRPPNGGSAMTNEFLPGEGI